MFARLLTAKHSAPAATSASQIAPAARSGKKLRSQNRALIVAALVFCAAANLFASPVSAQEGNDQQDSIISRGDAVVTGFSGIKVQEPVPETVHPLDRTFIDTEGTSAEVLDLTDLGTAPRGQLSDAPIKLKIKSSEIGQVFGVTLDDAETPNAYVTATSMYALQIVDKNDKGEFERLVKGGSDAEWMPGQFGPGGPGAIYKIDGVTGKVALFATVKLDGRDNAGPALGNVAYDKETKQLFVSDLETGMIHRISLEGKDLGTFDHGTTAREEQGLDAVPHDASKRMDIKSDAFESEAPETWGYADGRRRVFGLAVSKGRLYYAVAEGPSVWSVSVDDDGNFGDDPRIELEPEGANADADITDIVFDGAGILIISQRGAITGNYDYSTFATPQQSRVLRYTWSDKEGRWTDKPEEYAIGLKKDYHATQGGVALSYGYDKYGKVDFGTCRQTVWTTGEHLRDGEDLKLVSTGGAEYVTGLQGNYKINLVPANAPPKKSWFVDTDGRFNDASDFGHEGDVAIYAPCEPRKGESEPPEDWEVIPPIEPPLDEPIIVVDKVCHPGAVGGLINCTITVTNISSSPVEDDAELDDVSRTLFGPGAGTIVPIVAATADAGVDCSATPTTDFNCTIPAELLIPGDDIEIDVSVDTHDLALAGNLGFRNCAMLHHPSGNAMACAKGGTDIVVEKVGPGFCLPGLSCKFGLMIKNAGDMPYNGDVLLADAMFVGGAVANAPVTSVNPPIACSAGDTNQLPFTCVTTLSLMPGEVQTHWIEATMPAPGGYWARNCFGALDPALLPLGPVPPGMGPGGGANPSCVWVHVPVPKQNLKLTKTALNNGKCAKKPGDVLDCDFELKVTNESLLPFSGSVKIEETLPAGATISAVTAPWICNGGPPTYTCDTAAVPVNIAPGASVAFNLTVSTTAAASEANLCKVPNKAKITTPAGGAAPNIDATDDESDAQGMTFGLAWVDPVTGITWVMCDPTNLKVEKTAMGPCEAAGDKYLCEYEVLATNMGPDPYQGPVKFDETFGTAPQNATFEGDLTCAGGGANYKCETPGAVTMAKGDSLTLKVKAIVSADTCELPNTAKMTFPPVGSKGNGDGTDDEASATADVPSPKCDRPDNVVPPPRVCPDGHPIPRSGRCPCDDGEYWSRTQNACIDDEPEEPEGCEPGPHEVRTKSGRCVCVGDYERNARGLCVPIDDDDEPETCVPGRNEILTRNNRCICRDGYERNRRGVCIPEENPVDECHEDGGKWYHGRCIFPPKECPLGTTGHFPDCHVIVPPPVKVCPPGTIGRFPRCRTLPKVCPPGTKGRYPNCREIPKVCPKGMIGKPPNCRERPKVCPPGTKGKFPKCHAIPKVCPKGMIGRPPNCRPKVTSCPPGMRGKPPKCRPIIKPPTFKIKPGFLKPKRQPGGPRQGGFKKGFGGGGIRF